MSNEGSVAPKERINIVYKAAGEGMAEIELPLKILTMGNFLGRQDDRSVEDRKPININKDNFGSVMAEQRLGLDICVPNELQKDEEGSELALDLRFSSLEDFTPDGLLAQVPQLRALMELRDALTALKGPLGNMPAFRSRLRELMDDDQARRRLLEELNAQDEKAPSGEQIGEQAEESSNS